MNSILSQSVSIPFCLMRDQRSTQSTAVQQIGRSSRKWDNLAEEDESKARSFPPCLSYAASRWPIQLVDAYEHSTDCDQQPKKKKHWYAPALPFDEKRLCPRLRSPFCQRPPSSPSTHSIDCSIAMSSLVRPTTLPAASSRKTILVTGAIGYIGSHTALCCLLSGEYRVVTIDK